MSSVTSIEHGARDSDLTGGAADAMPPAAAPLNQGFRPWHFFVLVSLIAATAAVVMSKQTSPEHLVLVSLVIASAGFAAAGFYRTFAPLVSDAPPSGGGGLNDRTRATLEREKMLTLRSIKELEFDRAMGKISERDFDEIAGRLRSRAIALIKELDTTRPGYRAEIERQLAARLAERAAQPPSAAAGGAVQCRSCGTANDGDAAFCKRCGARIGETVSQEG